MAISAAKTWIPGEVLTASDLNSEFARIYTNAGSGSQSLNWPATSSKDFDGNILILDADADTSIRADTDDQIDVKLGNVDLFKFDGTTASSINGFAFTATASGTDPGITTFGGSTFIDFDFNLKGGSNAFLKVGGTRVVMDGEEDTAQFILPNQIFG